MPKRLPFGWLILLVAAIVALGLWARLGRHRPVDRPAATPLDLTKHDGQTIDYSSGKPVVKDTPEDKAALEKAAKEMAEAARSVTFVAPKKKPGPPPAPPKN